MCFNFLNRADKRIGKRKWTIFWLRWKQSTANLPNEEGKKKERTYARTLKTASKLASIWKIDVQQVLKARWSTCPKKHTPLNTLKLTPMWQNNNR